MDELEYDDKVEKWSLRGLNIYGVVNAIGGGFCCYQIIFYNDFTYVIKVAGFMNLATFFVVCCIGGIFQMKIKGRFSGEYIQNVKKKFSFKKKSQKQTKPYH